MLFAVERKGRSSQQRPSLLAGTTGAAAACSIIEVASRPGSSSSGVRRRPSDGGLRHSDGVDAQPLCLQQRKLLLTGGTAASCHKETYAMQQNIATVLRLQEADHRHLPCHALLPVRGPSRRDPTHPRSCIRPQASAICPRSRPRSRCRSCDVPAPADIRSRPDRTRRASLRTAASI
jgi:hypothetical protein